MAISKKALQSWLDTLHSDADLAIDDDGLILKECGGEAYLEIGGETEEPSGEQIGEIAYGNTRLGVFLLGTGEIEVAFDDVYASLDDMRASLQEGWTYDPHQVILHD